MADIEKGLPVRTEDDSDKYVRVKVADPTTASQMATVDSDQNFHVEAHGNNPAGGDEVLRLSELGAPNPDGDYDATNNTKPASSALIVHDKNASPNDTHQNVRVTGIQGTADNTIHAAHVAMLDEKGDAFSASNPLPTQDVGTAGDPKHDFNEAVNLAASGTSNHDYSVANGKLFHLKQVLASASSRIKITLQIGDGAVSEVFATKAVSFQSEEQSGGANIELLEPIQVTGTVNTTTIRVIRENRDDDDAQSVYTTIVGSEE